MNKQIYSGFRIATVLHDSSIFLSMKQIEILMDFGQSLKFFLGIKLASHTNPVHT